MPSRGMELDRFYPPSVAFEFNGPQHYGATGRLGHRPVPKHRLRRRHTYKGGSGMATTTTTTPPTCPQLGTGTLTTWDLNSVEISPTAGIQGNRFVSKVAPAASVWFTAATTTFEGNDHGLLVNADPLTNTFRIWDLDTPLGAQTGLGASFLDQQKGLLWVASAVVTVHRVDPLGRNQLTWTLPLSPAVNFVVRGLTTMPDGTAMLSVQEIDAAGSIQNLDPSTDKLTVFTLPTVAAPFSGAVAPDGTFFFCEFDTNRIGRLDRHKTTNNLTEWQLPGKGNPVRLFVDRCGLVWFADQAGDGRVGLLNPRRNTVRFFSKQGLVPVDVAPAGPPHFVAIADGTPFIDVLCTRKEPRTRVPAITSTVVPSVVDVEPVQSRPALFTRTIEPTVTEITPIDPPDFTRYLTPTPQLAITQHQGCLYANGVNFIQSVFRFYQLQVPGLS